MKNMLTFSHKPLHYYPFYTRGSGMNGSFLAVNNSLNSSLHFTSSSNLTKKTSLFRVSYTCAVYSQIFRTS